MAVRIYSPEAVMTNDKDIRATEDTRLSQQFVPDLTCVAPRRATVKPSQDASPTHVQHAARFDVSEQDKCHAFLVAGTAGCAQHDGGLIPTSRATLGFEAVGNSSDEASVLFKAESVKWAKVSAGWNQGTLMARRSSREVDFRYWR